MRRWSAAFAVSVREKASRFRALPWGQRTAVVVLPVGLTALRLVVMLVRGEPPEGIALFVVLYAVQAYLVFLWFDLKRRKRELQELQEESARLWREIAGAAPPQG